ncbi:MAG: hypothetical protein V4760_01565 [Bdellovibrionota bacterium]
MIRQLVKLLTHAVYFGIAVLIGIYLVTSASGGQNILIFVAIYLGLVTIEAMVEERILGKKSIGQATLSATLALAAGVVAFILFLFIGYSIGEVTPNRILSGLAAVVLFSAIEFPIRFGLEKLTRSVR